MSPIKWDMPAFRKVTGREASVENAVASATAKIDSRANSLGSGFKSGPYYENHHKSTTIGEQPARYGSDVQHHGGNQWPIGIVYTANYAAMLDNSRNNTLLKAK